MPFRLPARVPPRPALRADERLPDRWRAPSRCRCRLLRPSHDELREHPLVLAVGKPAAVVLDRDHDFPRLSLCPHPHDGSRGRVLRAVLEQVAKRLFDQHCIDAHQRQIVGQFDDEPMRRHALAQSGQCRTDNLVQGGPVSIHLDGARFQTRHLQDLRHAFRHFPCLVEDAFRQRSSLRRVQSLAAFRKAR